MGFGRGLLLWLLGLPFRSLSCSRCSGAEAPNIIVRVRRGRRPLGTATPGRVPTFAAQRAPMARVALRSCAGKTG